MRLTNLDTDGLINMVDHLQNLGAAIGYLKDVDGGAGAPSDVTCGLGLVVEDLACAVNRLLKNNYQSINAALGFAACRQSQA